MEHLFQIFGYVFLCLISIGMLYVFVRTLSYMLTTIEDGDDE